MGVLRVGRLPHIRIHGLYHTLLSELLPDRPLGVWICQTATQLLDPVQAAMGAIKSVLGGHACVSGLHRPERYSFTLHGRVSQGFENLEQEQPG